MNLCGIEPKAFSGSKKEIYNFHLCSLCVLHNRAHSVDVLMDSGHLSFSKPDARIRWNT